MPELVAGSNITLTPNTTTNTLTVAAAAGGGGSAAEIDTRSALAALAIPAAGTARFLTEAGRSGWFVFDSSNLSTKVTGDPNQGVHVAPSAASSGSSGAWVRRFSGAHDVKWFGATGDGTTNDGAAFLAAIAYLKSVALAAGTWGYSSGSPELFIPKGHYYLGTNTLDLTSTIILTGESGTEASGPATLLRWALNADGIRVQAGNTTGATGTQTETGLGGDGSIIRNLFLHGGYAGGADGEYHAVRLRSRATLRDLFIAHWQGDGIYSVCSAGSGGTEEGNANNIEATRIFMEDLRTGVYVDGADVNAGVFTSIDVKNCRAYGIWDSSFLANTHLGHHVGSSGIAPYRSDSAGNRSPWVGCYSEGGQPASEMYAPAVVMGGLHGADFSSDSTALLIGCQTGLAINTVGYEKSIFDQTRIRSQVASNTLALHNPQGTPAMAAGIATTLLFEEGYESGGVTPAKLASLYTYSTTASAATAETIMVLALRTFAGGGAVTDRFVWDGSNLVYRPATDNTTDTGTTGTRWKNIYGYTIDAKTQFNINGTKVIGSRITGWAAATNTKSKATFDTTTVTLPQLASRVGQLIDDLMTHGVIGT